MIGKCESCGCDVIIKRFRKYKVMPAAKLCSNCYQKKWAAIRKKEKIDYAINEFVDRIEARNGWATDNEVFVELIGLYVKYDDSGKIDKMNAKDQLLYMWSEIKKLRYS
jgi:uncharacterized protein YggL (DUF469 family)